MTSAMKKGFTLVELSIVLVIIGLLIGGILVGQSLIESTKTNKIISTANQYKIMIRNFYDKTKCLPGDCPSSVSGGSSGNNDDAVGGDGVWGYYVEPVRVLSQLFSMKIYQNHDGDFSNCSHYSAVVDIDCFIKGPHEESYFSLRSTYNGSSMAYGPYGMPNWTTGDHWLQYGQFFTQSSAQYQQCSLNPIISPATAKSVDIKSDDGNPATGKVMGTRKHSVTNCLTATLSTPGVDYDLSKDDPECNVFFYISNYETLDYESF